LLDGEFNLVCGTLDVAAGNFLGVEHHHINVDVLGFQLSAICIRKRHKTLWGCAADGNLRRSPLTAQMRSVGGRRCVVRGHQGGIAFDNRVDLATHIYNREDVALVGEYSR
jgi:hypothetical protein